MLLKQQSVDQQEPEGFQPVSACCRAGAGRPKGDERGSSKRERLGTRMPTTFDGEASPPVLGWLVW